jgi:hypothetical protein
MKLRCSPYEAYDTHTSYHQVYSVLISAILNDATEVKDETVSRCSGVSIMLAFIT